MDSDCGTAVAVVGVGVVLVGAGVGVAVGGLVVAPGIETGVGVAVGGLVVGVGVGISVGLIVGEGDDGVPIVTLKSIKLDLDARPVNTPGSIVFDPINAPITIPVMTINPIMIFKHRIPICFLPLRIDD